MSNLAQLLLWPNKIYACDRMLFGYVNRNLNVEGCQARIVRCEGNLVEFTVSNLADQQESVK